MSGNWHDNNWTNKKPWERNWNDPANPAYQQQQQDEARRRQEAEQANAARARAQTDANAAGAARRAKVNQANADLLRNRPTPRPTPTTQAAHPSTAAPRIPKKSYGPHILGGVIALGIAIFGGNWLANYYDANWSTTAMTMQREAKRCVARNDRAIDDAIARHLMAAKDKQVEHVEGVRYCVNIVRSHYGGHSMPTIDP